MRTRSGPLIEAVDYQPPAGHRFGLELIPAHDLLRRASRAHFQAPQRIGFYLAMAVTHGRLRRTIDFVSHTARPGQWMLAAPQQVQQFDLRTPWQGWLVVVRPEFLLSGEAWHHLPTVASPDATTHEVCLSVLERMAVDARRDAAVHWVEPLLRHQLHTVLARLLLAHAGTASASAGPAAALGGLLQRYRAALEQHLAARHRAADYPAVLGCSPRALARSCAAAGTTPKRLLDERIVLEAKRLLAHTDRAAGSIGLELGFDDASNFGKFFRRAVGCTPQAFRQALESG